jgi:aminotransferase
MPRPARHMERVSEALSIKYNNLVYELQEAGADVIVLSLGEAFFDLPLHDFSSLPQPAIFHYSHSRGLPALRERLAGYYDERYGVPVDPADEIIVTAGSKVAIQMSLMSLLDPGDEVIVHEPAWVSYVEQVRLCHGVPVTVPYDVPVGELEAFVTPRTRVIVLNYPNNPRGQTLGAGDWERLHEVAERRDLFLLCDEAYSDFLPPGERFVSGGLGDPGKRHTLICNSMSKNYGMSGWRVGYVIANPEVTAQVLKVNQHLVTCPATILSHYLVEHFHDLLEVTGPQIRAVVDKRAEVARELDRIGLEALPGSATFYLFVSIAPSALGSEAFCTRLLTEHHVAAVPGIGYGESCDAFIRVSVGTESMERTIAGLEAVKALIDATAAAETGPPRRVAAGTDR